MKRLMIIVALIPIITSCGTPSQIFEGQASYYADSLHGNPTASGETYDKDAYTAAHRTLPFGTTVRVVNLENNKSVKVKINDRGPHTESRIIDLSKAAAEKIDMVDKGTVQVRVEVFE